MKKLILPLLLLLGITMLMAVESAPSAIVGYVKYDCVAGLNYIALPMNAGYGMASDLANAYPGVMDVINYWDNTTQSWVAANDLGFMWDGDFPVAPGNALMVNAVSATPIYSIGAMPATNASYSMVAGLNSIMLPLNKGTITLASELGVDVGILDVINYWDNTTQSWVAANDLGFMWDGDFPITIGMPLMANALSSAVWPTGARTNSARLSTSK